MPARKKPTTEPKGRCTKAEHRIRILKLVTLSRNGWSTSQMQEYAIEEFGLKDDAARKLVIEALDFNVDAYAMYDKRRIAAMVLGRAENAYRLAASQRNPSAMVAANAQIALHWVHRAPEITVSGGAAADNSDPEENF